MAASKKGLLDKVSDLVGVTGQKVVSGPLANEPRPAPGHIILPQYNEFILTSSSLTRGKQPKEASSLNESLLKHLNEATDETAIRAADVDMIIGLSPEIKDAIDIFSSAVLSPDNQLYSGLPVSVVESNFSETITNKASSIVSDHANKTLGLGKQLKTWLVDARYKYGAKPIAVIPILPPKEKSSVSLEYTSSQSSARSVSEIFTSLSKEGKVKEDTFTISTESFDVPEDMVVRTKEATVSVNTSDLPNLTFLDGVSHLKTLQTSTESVRAKFKSPGVHVVTDSNGKKGAASGSALVIPLPAEATIPIFIPGSPRDHLGYFVLLDKQGYPLKKFKTPSSTNTKSKELKDIQAFSNLYEAWGLKQEKDETREDVLTSAYTTIVQNYISGVFKQENMDGIEPLLTQAIGRHLYASRLAKDEVKVMFIPADYVAYIAFDYDDATGRGKSCLESARFSLSLYITILVSNVLSATKAAIDRRKVEITFPDQIASDPQISPQLSKLLNQIQQQAAESNTIIPSIDPSALTKDIALQGVQLKVNNAPGLEGFNVDSSYEQVGSGRTNKFDTDLFEALQTSLLRSLDVTSSMINAVRENDYVYSLVSQNTTFAQRVGEVQSIYAENLEKVVRTEARHNAVLKRELASLIEAENKQAKGKKNDTAGKDTTGSISEELSADVDRLIEGIRVRFPKPASATIQSQNDQFDKFTNVIDRVVDLLLPDDLAGADGDLERELTGIRSTLKSQITHTYLKQSAPNIAEMIPDIESPGFHQIVATQLASLKNLQALKTKLTTAMNEQSGSEDTGGF